MLTVDRYNYDVAKKLYNISTVVQGRRTRLPTSTMYEQHYWHALAASVRAPWRKHVQMKTVLASLTTRTKGRSILGTSPSFSLTWWLPAEEAHRRGSIWNSLKCP